MSLGSNFLKPAIAPLNFANVSLMGGIITSGLRELAAENLRGQLRLGIAGAAKGAGVRPADIEKLLPMARFDELGAKIDGNQKTAVAAWRDRPVESRRAADLAKLTETGKLPSLSDSLARLSVMAGPGTELGRALWTMSEVSREWQALVLEGGNKLDDNRTLSDAFRKRALRRGAGLLVFVGLGGGGVFLWQRGEQAHYRINAQLGNGDPCAVLAIDAKDMERAKPEQKVEIERRKKSCDERRERQAKDKEERAKKDAYDKQCAELATALGQKKPPAALDAIPTKQLALAIRIGKGELDGTDYGPKDPAFPCAETDSYEAIRTAFDKLVAGSTGWMEIDDLSPRVVGALGKHADLVPESVRKDLDQRAEKESVDALVDKSVAKMEHAKHLCRLKILFKIDQKSFCRAITN